MDIQLSFKNCFNNSATVNQLLEEPGNSGTFGCFHNPVLSTSLSGISLHIFCIQITLGFLPKSED